MNENKYKLKSVSSEQTRLSEVKLINDNKSCNFLSPVRKSKAKIKLIVLTKQIGTKTNGKKFV